MNCLLKRSFLFSILFLVHIHYLCSVTLRNPFEVVTQTLPGVKPFKLLGIVTVDYECSALLKIGDVAHVVSIGDQVEQYRVASITHSQITLESKDHEVKDIRF